MHSHGISCIAYTICGGKPHQRLLFLPRNGRSSWALSAPTQSMLEYLQSCLFFLSVPDPTRGWLCLCAGGGTFLPGPGWVAFTESSVGQLRSRVSYVHFPRASNFLRWRSLVVSPQGDVASEEPGPVSPESSPTYSWFWVLIMPDEATP